MNEQITNKSTKNEILDAYETLLKEVKSSKKESRQQIAVKDDNEKIVQSAKNDSSDNLAMGIADLKIKTSKLFDEISEKIIEQSNKLETIEKAIVIEDKRLHEKYQINSSADTLEVLLLTQRKNKECFEQEMENKKFQLEQEIDQKKLEWKKEQFLFEQKCKEENERLTKERKRETEDYQYKINIERQKDKDQYEVEKINLQRELQQKRDAAEKDLIAREINIVNNEKELSRLNKEVAEFPEILKKAVTDAKEKAVSDIQKEYNFNTNLTAKEIAGELKLKDQIISTQASKIKEMQVHIDSLNKNINDASKQVQDIALKAIEGASGIKARFFNENNKEQSLSQKI